MKIAYRLPLTIVGCALAVGVAVGGTGVLVAVGGTGVAVAVLVAVGVAVGGSRVGRPVGRRSCVAGLVVGGVGRR